MSRKQFPVEALIHLRQRLEMLPSRSPERRRLIEETATLYGVSIDTLYRGLREQIRPKTVHRSDRGAPRKSDTPSEAGGLMSGTASKAGVLAKDVCVDTRIDRSYQRFPDPECSDVQPLAQSQLSRQHSPWPRNSLLENCAAVP